MPPSGSEVGIRLFLVGKDAVIGGLKELQGTLGGVSGATDSYSLSSGRAAKSSDMFALSLGRERNELDDLILVLGETNLAYDANLRKIDDAIAENKAYSDSMLRLTSVGRTAFFGLAAAAAVGTVASVKWFTAFQTNLTMLNTQAGWTVAQMNEASSWALANAAKLGVTPNALVQALYHPASAGFRPGTAEAIATQGANLSILSGASTEETTNAMTSLVKAYGGNRATPGQVEQQAALVNALVGSGNMRMAQFNQAVGTGVFMTGKLFGVSEKGVGSAVSLLTDLGMDPAQAGTRLRMFMALAGAPSQKAMKYLTAAGLTKGLGQDQSAVSAALTAAGLGESDVSQQLRNNSGAGGVYNAINLILTHLKSSGVPTPQINQFLAGIFGGGRSGTGGLTLAENMGLFARKGQQINRLDTTGRLQHDIGQKHGTLDFQSKEFVSSIESLGTAFGKFLAPPLLIVMKALNGVLGLFNRYKVLLPVLAGLVTLTFAPAIGLYLVSAYKRLTASLQKNTIWGDGWANMQKRMAESAGQTSGAIAVEDDSLATNDEALASNTAAARSNTAAHAADDVAMDAGAGAADAGLLGGLAGAAGIGIPAAIGAVGVGVLGAGVYGLFKTANQKAPMTNAMAQARERANPQGSVGMGGLVSPIDLSKPIGSDFVMTPQLKAYWDTYEETHSKPVVVHSHVHLDGKEIYKTVTKHSKKAAARS
jgi:TP901 family phage tail tape measure protein